MEAFREEAVITLGQILSTCECLNLNPDAVILCKLFFIALFTQSKVQRVELGMSAHTRNPGPHVAEAGLSQIPGHSGLHSEF